MIADPERSLDYFETVEASQAEGVSDASSSSLKRISSGKEFESITSNGKVVVEFWAPWCGKCKQIAPYLEELASKYADSVAIGTVDTTDDALEGLITDLGVKGLPAFRFYKNGKEMEELRVIGYKKQVLQENIDKLNEL